MIHVDCSPDPSTGAKATQVVTCTGKFASDHRTLAACWSGTRYDTHVRGRSKPPGGRTGRRKGGRYLSLQCLALLAALSLALMVALQQISNVLLGSLTLRDQIPSACCSIGSPPVEGRASELRSTRGCNTQPLQGDEAVSQHPICMPCEGPRARTSCCCRSCNARSWESGLCCCTSGRMILPACLSLQGRWGLLLVEQAAWWRMCRGTDRRCSWSARSFMIWACAPLRACEGPPGFSYNWAEMARHQAVRILRLDCRLCVLLMDQTHRIAGYSTIRQWACDAACEASVVLIAVQMHLPCDCVARWCAE